MAPSGRHASGIEPAAPRMSPAVVSAARLVCDLPTAATAAMARPMVDRAFETYGASDVTRYALERGDWQSDDLGTGCRIES